MGPADRRAGRHLGITGHKWFVRAVEPDDRVVGGVSLVPCDCGDRHSAPRNPTGDSDFRRFDKL